MDATMKAAQFYGARDVRICQVPKPTPAGNQVLVTIEWCGICGTDLHEYLKGPLVIPKKEKPHRLTGETMPVTLGHEFCGRISYTPQGSKLKVGQPVMVDPRLFCSSCDSCSKKQTNICSQWGFLGLSGRGGGLAQEVAVEPEMCHVLPEEVYLRYAALIEPLVVARHVLKSSGQESFNSSNVLIIGGGPVGLALAVDLRAHKVMRVIVSEPSSIRRMQVGKFCDFALDPTQTSVADECRKLTGGNGVDIVFDCAGILQALDSGFDALRCQGTYVNVAGWETQLVVPMKYFHQKEIVFRASMAYNEQDFEEVVRDFVEGKFPGVEQMVTARIALDDVKAAGFEELVTNKDNHIKILVTPKSDLLSQ